MAETLKCGSRKLLVVGADSPSSLPASKIEVKAGRIGEPRLEVRDLKQSTREGLLELCLEHPSEVFMKHKYPSLPCIALGTHSLVAE